LIDARQPTGFRWFLAIFALLAAALGIAGVALHRAQTRNVVRLHRQRLEATARSLADRLVEWRRARLADAQVLALAPAVGTLLEAPPTTVRPGIGDLSDRLDHVRRLYEYESVALLDREGRPRVVVPREGGSVLEPGALPREPPALVEDLGTGHGHIHLVAVAEVTREGRRQGYVALTSQAGEAVGRLREGWPVSSGAAEAMVLSEAGGSVVALTGAEPMGRAPQRLDALLAAAAPALREGWGSFEALDDRGQDVLAVAARVPSSPWFVLVKMDRGEVLATARATATTTAVLFVALIALAGLGIHLVWLRQRRAADGRLLESQRRYDLLFRNSLSGVAVHEIVRDDSGRAVDWVYIEANPAFERLTGLRRQDILGRRATEVLPGIEKTPFMETYGRVVLSGEPWHSEEFSPLLGRHYEVAAFPMDGEMFGTIFTDLTPRREAEAALRESERYLRALFEGALDPVLVADDEGCWVDVNPAAARAFGLARAEMLGRRIGDFAADPNFDFAATWRAFLDAGQMTGTFRARRADGTVCAFEYAATARVAPGRHLSVLREVTERDRAKQALEESESRFRLVLETIPVGVWLIDRTGRITYANPAARRIWGGVRFVGPEGFDVFKGWRLPDREPIQAKEWGAVRALERGLATFGESIEIQAFDGVRRQILHSALPIRDESGTIMGVLVMNEDVTERTRLEQNVQQSRKMEAVGRLAGGVAHDFNNLLAIITGRAELLQRLLSPRHGGRRHLEELLEASERAADLTRQLLAFGRKQLLQRRPVRLNDAVDKIRPMLERLLGEDLQLRTELEEGVAPVLADAHQLEQVLVNLAVNARDAMPDGGTLTIATSEVVVEGAMARRRHPGLEPGRYALLTVADTGHGMDVETRSHLFEPFFTTKEEGQGTGLGLSTVYGIVSQNDGHISVDSEPGRGTTFRIHLPVTEEQVEEADATGTAPPPRGTETILLVEDERSLRDVIGEDLEELGYTVLAAANGSEALGLAASHRGGIDLVLTDVILPKMNGRELVTKLSEEHAGLAAVYMSGYTANVIARHGVLEEGVHFVQKPFAARALAERIRKALDGRTGGG
jgi:two-component system cell cycle sensor histidine kinase/response regulator CckA